MINFLLWRRNFCLAIKVFYSFKWMMELIDWKLHQNRRFYDMAYFVQNSCETDLILSTILLVMHKFGQNSIIIFVLNWTDFLNKMVQRHSLLHEKKICKNCLRSILNASHSIFKITWKFINVTLYRSLCVGHFDTSTNTNLPNHTDSDRSQNENILLWVCVKSVVKWYGIWGLWMKEWDDKVVRGEVRKKYWNYKLNRNVGKLLTHF